MAVEIALRSDLHDYQMFLSTLDDVVYQLTLTWNAREAAWYMSLAAEDGTEIWTGQKVVVNWPLCRRRRHPLQPPGMLIAIDTSGRGLDPGEKDLGDRVRMFYYSASELG